MPSLTPILLLVLALSAGGSGVTQPGDPARHAHERWGTPAVTLSDIAVARARVERALVAFPPSADRLPAINTAVDRAVSFTLSGQPADAVRTLHEALDLVLPPEPESAARLRELRIARSLKVAIDPPVYVLGAGRPSLSVSSMYPLTLTATEAGRAPMTLVLRVRSRAGGAVIGERDIELPMGQSPLQARLADIPFPVGRPAPGAYDLSLVTPGDGQVDVGTIAVSDHSLGAVRIANTDRLARVVVETPELQHALSLCRARNGLLSDRPSASAPLSLIGDLPALESAVQEELHALQDLHNPYRRLTGLLWWPVVLSGRDVGARLYAPPPAKGDDPMPLVIALHGAAGDPDTLLEDCGDGLLRRLADKGGFLVVAPQVDAAAAAPELFDAIIEAASFDYPLDPSRIYIIAHSTGDNILTNWGEARRDRIAAACLFSGLVTPGRVLPTTLVVAGALDPLVGPELAEREVAAARDTGSPVEFRRVENFGHTLVVAEALPEAVDWLLRHRLR